MATVDDSRCFYGTCSSYSTGYNCYLPWPACDDEPEKRPPWWVAFLQLIVPKKITPGMERDGKLVWRTAFLPRWKVGRWKSKT